MTVLLSNFSLSRGWVASEKNACCALASKFPRERELSVPTLKNDMNYPLADHSDEVLAKINKFFEHYRPNYQDVEWAKKRKAEVRAEIERRKQEDKEAAR